jgi:hypothetical protein
MASLAAGVAAVKMRDPPSGNGSGFRPRRMRPSPDQRDDEHRRQCHQHPNR